VALLVLLGSEGARGRLGFPGLGCPFMRRPPGMLGRLLGLLLLNRFPSPDFCMGLGLGFMFPGLGFIPPLFPGPITPGPTEYMISGPAVWNMG